MEMRTLSASKSLLPIDGEAELSNVRRIDGGIERFDIARRAEDFDPC
jgi:hypothetical protein